MIRVDELQNKYPSIPRQTLIKAEVLTRGIKDSEELYKHSVLHRTGGTGSYQSYDRVSLKELANRRPGGAAEAGYVRRTETVYMKGGWGVMVQRDPTSPYEIREPEPGHCALFEGEEKVQNVYFPEDKKPWPYRERKEPLTSSGKPITTVVAMRSATCARMTPVRHCEYFSTGEQCKFCNFNVTQDDARSIGSLIPITSRLDEMAEAYKILTSEVRIVELALVGGAFAKIDNEVRMYADLIEKVGAAASYKVNVNLTAQPPKSRRDLQRLKDAGLDAYVFDPEVWDPEMFAEICPGKAKHIGFERFKEAFLEAVDVFGPGYVQCALVMGATLLPANGHRTWQESRDTLIEGVRWVIKNGVTPVALPLRLAPGSEFSKDPTSKDRMPPVEHHLDALLAIHAAMKEHGLYDKMNRFAGACPMCCEEIMFWGDLGIWEATGGNISKWLAGVIPDEVNWLIPFVKWIEEAESVKAQS